MLRLMLTLTGQSSNVQHDIVTALGVSQCLRVVVAFESGTDVYECLFKEKGMNGAEAYGPHVRRSPKDGGACVEAVRYGKGAEAFWADPQPEPRPWFQRVPAAPK